MTTAVAEKAAAEKAVHRRMREVSQHLENFSSFASHENDGRFAWLCMRFVAVTRH